MDLIIKIPDDWEKRIREMLDFQIVDFLYGIIRNGIPIPDNATNGEWIDQYNDGNWHCSKCGAIVEKDEQINHNWYFCYHCGAKMNAPYQKGGNIE